MARDKTTKASGGGVPQKHLHSRLSFLHQAASYLATANDQTTSKNATASNIEDAAPAQATQGQQQPAHDASRLLTHLRGVSKKSQIRLSPKVKHTICKRCDALLVPGKTSTVSTVNASKGGKKAWADILETKCEQCRTVKRFPVGIARTKRVAEGPIVDC